MDFEEFKKQYHEIFDAMSEAELIAALAAEGAEFEESNCELETGDVENPIIGAAYSSRATNPDICAVDPLIMAADSNELALAA